jgi:hypothetical protein
LPPNTDSCCPRRFARSLARLSRERKLFAVEAEAREVTE